MPSVFSFKREPSKISVFYACLFLPPSQQKDILSLIHLLLQLILPPKEFKMIGKATANVVRNTKATRVLPAQTRAFGSESSPSQYQKNLVDPDTR